MKIIYIANARIPSEKVHPYQILKMCEAFAKNDVDVELVLPFRFQTTKKLKQIRDIWKYYGVDNKFKIIKLPSFDLIWIDLYTMKLSSLRFRIQATSFAISATFYSLFKKADVYYTRSLFFVFFFGLLRFLHRKRIYYEAHAFGHFVNKLAKRGRIDKLIVNTNRIKEEFIRRGFPEDKVLVAADGVDLEEFDIELSKEEVRKKTGLPLNKKTVLYAGSLYIYKWKGVDILIQASQYLPDDAIVVFVGDIDKGINKYREKFMESNIIFEGYHPHPEIPYWLKSADVLILPNTKGTSLSEFYISPLKLFEYMASKRPIVASDLPSSREILNENNAVLVEPNNPKMLAEGIKKVLDDEELTNEIAKNAYKDVQKYTWENRARRILQFMGCKE